MSQYLRLIEVANLFGVSRQAVLLWVNKGLIKAIRVDKMYLVPAEEVERLMNGGEKDGKHT